ncbi:hypothetical protein KC19_1G147200 [Ceratodon purpureus]|uniref:16S rRNA (uracil(1498)-N(3))-methyltransferase n=1 Tax=Ceratodon purpureus TaxID=3225 RepID=A0A8T0J875_CERPU|nr:hypothetical protein KC19_1G147200 [Ceratodon purpureus]
MVASTFTTASLLKFYVKWPPPSILRGAYSNSSLSLRDLEGVCQLNSRGLSLSSFARPGFYDFRNARRAAQCGNASRITAFAKDLHKEAEEQEVVSDQSRGGLPRFHVTSLPALKGTIVQVDGDEFWHMTRVLRLNVNDRIELFDGSGGIVEGTLLRVTKNCAEVSALTGRQTLPQTGPNWHVAAAFGNLKGGRADWLVEKCTELGAQTLTPLLTQRSGTVAEQRNDRWHRISMAATKQCQRLHTLDVREPTRLESLLTEVRKAKVAFLAAAGAPPLVQTLLNSSEMPQEGLLLIGPEGDFTQEEIELLIEAGAVPVGLGQRRLRVETAAIAILSTVMLLSEGCPVNAKEG